jgi:acetyltransferase-like isoleucine patch superfamily enzyme
MRLLNYLLERNIYNLDTIDQFIVDLSQTVNNPNVVKWLKSNLKNYLINKYDNVQLLTQLPKNAPLWAKKSTELYQITITREFKDKIHHVVDYLRTLPGDISRISVLDAISKSEEWTRQLIKKASSDEDSSDVKLIKKYPNGMFWVRLLTKQALEREGKLMGHCVGGYCDYVISEQIIIYSLRDTSNNPHVTIEQRENIIYQIKGRGNKEVVPKYHKYVIDFINSGNYDEVRDTHNINMIFIDSKLYTYDNLPKVVKGDLNLSNTPIEELPDNVSIGGDLYLYFGKIRKIGKNLVVKGNCNLSYTPIEEIPDNVNIGGNLDLYDSKIKKIGKNLVVNGNCNLSHTPIEEIQDNVNIGGNLYLYDSKIKKIDKNLVVKGDCNLSHTPIEELPDNVNIGGNLNLSYSNIKKIGKNLVVKGNCDLPHTPIEELPDNASIGSNLNLSYSNIKKIGKNLVVKGNCDLPHTPIEELPDNVNIGGNLYLYDSKIKKIGKNLVVKGNCHLSHTPIEELPDNVSIGGNLYITKNQYETFKKYENKYKIITL